MDWLEWLRAIMIIAFVMVVFFYISLPSYKDGHYVCKFTRLRMAVRKLLVWGDDP